jgi:hypothetical protein
MRKGFNGLSMLLEGIDWRIQKQTWKPIKAG